VLFCRGRELAADGESEVGGGNISVGPSIGSGAGPSES
jgi:hypothetical protein